MPYKFHDLSWTRGNFTASTDPSLLQAEEINKAFELDAIYWCKPLPLTKLREILDNSLCIGLYDLSTSIDVQTDPGSSTEDSAIYSGAPHSAKQPARKQIGLMRFITDYATFAWGTDYYVLPEYRKLGLGEWLLECFNGLMNAMEHSMDQSLRPFRMMSAGRASTVDWYAKNCGFRKLEHGDGGVVYLVRDEEGKRRQKEMAKL